MIDQDQVYEDWKKRFPLCFKKEGCCMYHGLSFESGWNKIVEKALTKIEAHLATVPQDEEHTFQIDQMKEKFGVLRWYATVYDDVIPKIIIDAEDESEKTCMLCGKEGSLHKKSSGGFWMLTLCPECAEKNDYIMCSKEKTDE